MTDPLPVPENPPVAHRRLMIAAAVSMVAFGAAVAVPSICLRPIGDEFTLTFAQRGTLGSVMMIGLVASLLAIGYVAERTGKRGFLVAGVIVIAAGIAATARAQSYVILLLARAVTGVGKGAMEALVNPLVAELEPRGAARRLNLINGLFAVGVVIAALLTGELLQAGVSWRITFLIWVIPTAGVAFLFAAKGYPSPRPAHERAGRWRAFLSDRLFRLLFLAMVLGGGCEAGLTFWGANFVEHELGASARSGAWTIALYGAFMAAGRFASGALLTRVRPVNLMIASAAACALSTFGIPFVEGIHAAWTFFALGGLFVACFWPTLLAVASDNIARGSSSLLALLAAGGILGCVFFPWAMGALGDLAGLRVGVALLPASMAGEVLVLIAIRAALLERRQEDSPPDP